MSNGEPNSGGGGGSSQVQATNGWRIAVNTAVGKLTGSPFAFKDHHMLGGNAKQCQ